MIQVEDTAGKPPERSEDPLAGPVKRTEAARAVEHLEGLDERILIELRKRGGGADASGDPATGPQRPDTPPAGGGEPADEESGLWVPDGARAKR